MPDKNVIFRRIKGRIVPISKSEIKTRRLATGAAMGAVVGGTSAAVLGTGLFLGFRASAFKYAVKAAVQAHAGGFASKTRFNLLRAAARRNLNASYTAAKFGVGGSLLAGAGAGALAIMGASRYKDKKADTKKAAAIVSGSAAALASASAYTIYKYAKNPFWGRPRRPAAAIVMGLLK